MDNQRLQQNSYIGHRISFACLVLCGILALILGVQPKLPSSVTQLLRPAFIAICLLTLHLGGYYKLGAAKYQLLNLAYFTIIFFIFPIHSNAIMTYVSILLFILFFIFAANRKWSRKEIALILLAVVIACDIQALLILYSNPGLLRIGGSSHLDFLGVTVNRNPVAFAITPGTLCGMFVFLYGGNRKSVFSKLFYLMSCLVCSFAVFALGCRSAFLSAAAGLTCIVWQKTRDGVNYKEIFNRRVFAIMIILLVVFTAYKVSAGTYSERLFDFSDASDDSGRDVLWEEAWNCIDENPVFGNGFGYWEESGHEMGTHNTFLTFMVSTGWVGGILLGWFLLMSLIEILKTRNLIPLSFMAELLLHSWTEPLMDYYAYVPLILAFILARYLQHKSNDLRTIFA